MKEEKNVLEENHDSIMLSSDFEDPILTENQEKIEALPEDHKKVLFEIVDWLKDNRKYKDYDLDDEFKVDKILPLVKFVVNKEIAFTDKNIIQKLRFPIELKDKNDNVVKKISELTYRTRYRAFELNNFTKGINLSKEMSLYMDAQVGMLTGIARSIIGKLYDSDHSVTRLIQSLYFL